MKVSHITGFFIVSFLATTMCVYARGGVNSGKQMPMISDSPDSAAFVASWCARDALKKGKRDITGEEIEQFMEYAQSFSKTLSQFSYAEQSYFWHGE